MHVCQRFFESSKHLLNSTSGIAFKAFFDSACISSIVSKWCPRSGLLSLENSQKSHGAESGEYGGCGSIRVEFLAKWSRRTSAVWDGALSWCKNHELSAQNIFWNDVEWSSWNANSVSMSLIVNRRFLCTNSLIWLTCCSLVDVDGRPGRSMSSTWSLPSLKSLYHHRRPSATFWTFPQLKFHSANKI